MLQSGFEFRRTIPCSADIVGESLGRKHYVLCRICGIASKPAGYHPPEVRGGGLPFELGQSGYAFAWLLR